MSIPLEGTEAVSALPAVPCEGPLPCLKASGLPDSRAHFALQNLYQRSKGNIFNIAQKKTHRGCSYAP